MKKKLYKKVERYIKKEKENNMEQKKIDNKLIVICSKMQ